MRPSGHDPLGDDPEKKKRKKEYKSAKKDLKTIAKNARGSKNY